jgi:hypothetical protein
MSEIHLYRHFAADGTLLYVGISQNAATRLYSHKWSGAQWVDQIARTEIETFATREAALAAEARAIASEKPIFNKAGLPNEKLEQAIIAIRAAIAECGLAYRDGRLVVENSQKTLDWVARTSPLWPKHER